MAWMQTLTGQRVELPAVDPATVKPADIAHHLAITNRYNGATTEPVSVARHSLLCLELAPEDLMLDALLHDAPEAYMGDITNPVMQALKEMSGAAAPYLHHLKRTVHVKVYEALGRSPAIMFGSAIKELDMQALSNERHAFMVPLEWDGPWNFGVPAPRTTTWTATDWFRDREFFARAWCSLDRSLDYHRDFYQPWHSAKADMPRHHERTVIA